jgi:hypothetical protein
MRDNRRGNFHVFVVIVGGSLDKDRFLLNASRAKRQRKSRSHLHLDASRTR